jgi:hypothetical protein
VNDNDAVSDSSNDVFVLLGHVAILDRAAEHSHILWSVLENVIGGRKTLVVGFGGSFRRVGKELIES